MSEIRTTEALENMLGQYGFTYIADTTKVTERFNAIQIITDAVVTTEGDVLTALALEAGTIVYGRFTSVTLASGSVIAYKG